MTTTMTTAPSHGHDCGCGCGPEVCDDSAGLERALYFPGQLVGPEDLTQDQRYFREKHRRHNRMLHGWGVVCGVMVQTAGDEQGNPIPYTVCVGSGYVLGPYGDEILVDHTVPFDVRALDPVQSACPPPIDPWCSGVRVDRDPGRTLYLAIRYEQCPARPVQTQSDCGCGAECEYSRIVDSFTLGVLDELPDAYIETHGGIVRSEDDSYAAGTLRCSTTLRRTGRPCPPCPTSPWVVLADFTVGPDGTVKVDPWAHRRFVAAYGSYGFYCTGVKPSDQPPTVKIKSPLDNAHLPAANVDPESFAATATDAEDGPLTGGSVQWFDSHGTVVDAILGQGTSFSSTLAWDDVDSRSNNLTKHTIKVVATDSKGNAATDSITVNVGVQIN